MRLLDKFGIQGGVYRVYRDENILKCDANDFWAIPQWTSLKKFQKLL
jgi:hypothetical protein